MLTIAFMMDNDFLVLLVLLYCPNFNSDMIHNLIICTIDRLQCNKCNVNLRDDYYVEK